MSDSLIQFQAGIHYVGFLYALSKHFLFCSLSPLSYTYFLSPFLKITFSVFQRAKKNPKKQKCRFLQFLHYTIIFHAPITSIIMWYCIYPYLSVFPLARTCIFICMSLDSSIVRVHTKLTISTC